MRKRLPLLTSAPLTALVFSSCDSWFSPLAPTDLMKGSDRVPGTALVPGMRYAMTVYGKPDKNENIHSVHADTI